MTYCPTLKMEAAIPFEIPLGLCHGLIFQTRVIFAVTAVITAKSAVSQNISLYGVFTARTDEAVCFAVSDLVRPLSAKLHIGLQTLSFYLCAQDRARYKATLTKQMTHSARCITAISHGNYKLRLLSTRFPVWTSLYGKQ
jgi:hypothetical protein